MTPDLLHATVSALMDQHRHQDALDLIERHPQLQRLDWRILFDIGMILLNLDRPSEAANAFHRAHRLEPGTSSLLFWAGHAHARAGEYDDAEAVLSRSLELKDDWWARLTLANVFLETDRPDDAEAVHLEGLGLEPESKERHQNYALFLVDIEELEQAHEHYLRALTLPFESQEARVARETAILEADADLRDVLAAVPCIEGVEFDWEHGPWSANPEDDADDAFTFDEDGFELGGEHHHPAAWACDQLLDAQALLRLGESFVERLGGAEAWWLTWSSPVAFLLPHGVLREHIRDLLSNTISRTVCAAPDLSCGIIVEVDDDGFRVGRWG